MTDEQWGQLSNACNFGFGSSTLLSTGLALCYPGEEERLLSQVVQLVVGQEHFSQSYDLNVSPQGFDG